MSGEKDFKNVSMSVPVPHDPEFERAVEVWLQYLIGIEIWTRGFPHAPANDGGVSVWSTTMGGGLLSETYHKELMRGQHLMARNCRADLGGIPKMTLKAANQLAQERRDSNLKPCPCRRCWEVRE